MESVAKANPDLKGLNPTQKRIAALFRRIGTGKDGRINY
jgi:hypothetical protein